jgi:hypothetical protein
MYAEAVIGHQRVELLIEPPLGGYLCVMARTGLMKLVLGASLG